MRGKGSVIWKMFHSPVSQALVVLANRITAAAAAWVMKYFVVASTARGWYWWAINGTMARVLISRPIHARSQLELMNVRVVPKPRVIKKRVMISGLIRKGWILTNILGVWAQKLN